jgi:hypothetical protein
MTFKIGIISDTHGLLRPEAEDFHPLLPIEIIPWNFHKFPVVGLDPAALPYDGTLLHLERIFVLIA